MLQTWKLNWLQWDQRQSSHSILDWSGLSVSLYLFTSEPCAQKCQAQAKKQTFLFWILNQCHYTVCKYFWDKQVRIHFNGKLLTEVEFVEQTFIIRIWRRIAKVKYVHTFIHGHTVQSLQNSNNLQIFLCKIEYLDQLKKFNYNWFGG